MQEMLIKQLNKLLSLIKYSVIKTHLVVCNNSLNTQTHLKYYEEKNDVHIHVRDNASVVSLVWTELNGTAVILY